MSTRFSAFGLLSGRLINTSEPPAQVVSTNPYSYSCAYTLPENTTHSEVSDVLSGWGLADIDLLHLTFNSKTGICIAGVQSEEKLSILKKSPFHLHGKRCVAQRIVEFKDSFVDVFISGLDAESYEVMTNNISDALGPFGEIKDIVFTRWGKVTDSCANIIIDLRSYLSLPEKLQIGTNIVDVSSKKMEAPK